MSDNRKFYILLVAITLLGALLRAQGIAEQPAFPDEVMSAWTAENYVEQGQFTPTMPYHPKLRNLLYYWSRHNFGEGSWSIRGWSVVFGTLSIALLGLLARLLSRSSTVGLIAAFLLCIDPVHITFSRQFIQEVHTAFFFLAGTVLVLVSTRGALEGEQGFYRAERLMPLAGVAFGLGLACKAHALMPMLVCIALVAYLWARGRTSAPEVIVAAVSLTVLPVAVFMWTYAPWFARGYDLMDWVFMQRVLAVTSVLHQGNALDIMVDDRAWLWFIKPFTEYSNFTHRDGKAFVTVAVDNPLIWMLVLPSCAWLIYEFRKTRDVMVALAVGLFLVAYLPLALSSRPLWILSSIAVTPFAYVMVAWMGASIAQRLNSGRQVLSGYLAIAFVASMLLYPLCTAGALEHGYLKPFTERLDPHSNNILKMSK